MELSSNQVQIIGPLIAAMGPIVAAYIASRASNRGAPVEGQTPPRWLFWGGTLGGALVLAAIVWWLIASISGPEPTVTIDQPTPGEIDVDGPQADKGSVSFKVKGGSTGIAPAPTSSEDRLEIYILVHPDPAQSWWVQPPATISPQDGDWTTVAWYGSHEYPPREGDSLSIMAIATTPENLQAALEGDGRQLKDPRAVSSSAQSDIVSLTIRRIK